MAKKVKKQGDSNKARPEVVYQTRKRVGLTPTDSLAEAGRKVLGFHFARMLKHEPGTRQGDDIEELHDMRVATRRMRAAFRVFGSAYANKVAKPLLRGLKATGRALGPVRDLDVFIEKMGHYQQTLPAERQAGLEPLLEAWAEKRFVAREQMLRYLDSDKYDQFKVGFLEFVQTEGLGAKPIPAAEFPVAYQLRHLAPGLIYTAYGDMRAVETVLEHAPVEVLHQLRINFKQLRYLLEFLREILGDDSELVIEEVKRMQDHLGDLQDAEVASRILQEFQAEWVQHQTKPSLAVQPNSDPLTEYIEAKLAERQQLLQSFPEAWTNFNRAEVRQALAQAVAVL